MKSEESIEILEAVKFILDNKDYSDRVEEAINMAIEALKEQRPHGEWITVCTLPIIQKCSNCKYVRKSGVEIYNFCPNCGAKMQANDRQVTGKLNSEICPCIDCCKLDNSELCRKGCSDYQKWKEGEA